MTARLIDLLCTRHRTLILETRMWPPGFDINSSCRACWDLAAPYRNSSIQTTVPGVDPDEQYAVHEAGHAVIHQSHGIVIEYAVLEPDYDGPGNARIRLADQYAPVDGYLQGTWGGVTASLHWLDRMQTLDDAATVDMVYGGWLDIAGVTAEGHSAEQIQAAYKPAMALTASLWPAIERVADMLLARGRLSGDEIADLAGLVTR